MGVFQIDVPAIGYTFPGLSMMSAIMAFFHLVLTLKLYWNRQVQILFH